MRLRKFTLILICGLGLLWPFLSALAQTAGSADVSFKGTADKPPSTATTSTNTTLTTVSSAGAPSTRAEGRPLTPDEKKRVDAGRTMYEATCLACHQPNGLGQPGLAPPLAGSEWVSGSPGRLIRIVLHGVRGPIKVKGETYELDMPALGVLDDEQIASALTYVRREWGHSFDPIDPAMVKKVRDETVSREDAWTQLDLLKIP